jgi:hypothetical protein
MSLVKSGLACCHSSLASGSILMAPNVCLPACAEASVGSRKVWLEMNVLLPGTPKTRIRQYRKVLSRQLKKATRKG